MTRRFFGTDGVRGKANVFPMTSMVALKLGIAAGHMFKRDEGNHTVVIGKDTRLSGYMLENALVSGFTAVGFKVILLGPIPTPAVAMLTRSMRADLGVMISASHNPYYDNGIKLFGPDGYKLSDDVETKIEDLIERGGDELLCPSDKIGQAYRLDAYGRYIEYVKNTFPAELTLEGLKVVIDCANGASYKVAPVVLKELGAHVIEIGVKPDGRNINKDCGAISTEFMREEVVKHGADVGISLDGDADRVMISDENGDLVDGDQLIALIATRMSAAGTLKNNTVVTTVMSNMGLENYFKYKGIKLIRSAVGDRYVVEKMRAHGYNLGGEQSGHIILGAMSTTGDGLMAGLQILAELVREGKKASEVTHVFTTFPQRLVNIRFDDKNEMTAVMESSVLKEAVVKAESLMKENGRVLIRKSGTEPLLRVMVEAKAKNVLDEVIGSLVATIEGLKNG